MTNLQDVINRLKNLGVKGENILPLVLKNYYGVSNTLLHYSNVKVCISSVKYLFSRREKSKESLYQFQ